MTTPFEFYTDEHVNKLQIYIESNFALDATSKRLVRNILEYVAVQSEDDDVTIHMLLELLDGIGITENDIITAICD